MKDIFITDTLPEGDLQCTLKTHVLSVLSQIGKLQNLFVYCKEKNDYIL